MLRLAVCVFAVFWAIPNGHTAQFVSLEDIVRNVLNSSLEIDKQQTFVDRSAAVSQQAAGAFDWNILAEGGFRRPIVIKSDQNNALTNETEVINVYNVNFGVEKRFRNGISIAPGVSFTQSLNEENTDILADSIPVGRIAVNIPLLQGRGTDANTANERSAMESFKATEYSRDRVTAKVLVNAVVFYWQSVAAKKNLEAEKRADKEAATLTDTLKKLSELGELSILEYQTNVANLNLRRLKIEKSAVTWNSTRRNLAQLANTVHSDENLPIPKDDFPNFSTEIELNLDNNALLDMAFNQRRDLLALQRKIQSKRLNLLKKRNDTQPKLDLNVDLDKITVSYVQTLDGNLSKGLEKDTAAELKAYEIDLQLLKRTITDDVYAATRRLSLSYKSYQRAHKARRLLEQIAKATREKVEQGTASRNEYLSALDKLLDVERIISSANVDYVAALAELRLATGTLPIGSENIKNTLNALLTVPTNG